MQFRMHFMFLEITLGFTIYSVKINVKFKEKPVFYIWQSINLQYIVK